MKMKMGARNYRSCGRARRWMNGAGACVLAAALAVGPSGCANVGLGAGGGREGGEAADGTTETHALEDLDLTFTSRDKDPSYDADTATRIVLNGAEATVEGVGAQAEGSTATITDEGTYVVSGTLDNGWVVVDTSSETKVQVVLDGASITNADGPAFYVKNADKCFLTLAEGSTNMLADGSQHAEDDEDDDLNAALLSNDDLTINGAGSLTVNGAYYHGIKSKDDLVITGGTFDITAAEDALHGNDCIKIADGTFTVNAGDDALHSDIFVLLDGGSVNVESCYEGLEGEKVIVNGGDHTVVASDDAVNASLASDDTTAADDAEVGVAPDAEGGVVPGAVPDAEDGMPPDGGDFRQMPDGAEMPGDLSDAADLPEGMERPERSFDKDSAEADGTVPEGRMQGGGKELRDGGMMPDGEGRGEDFKGGDMAVQDSDMPKGGMGGGGMAASSDACLIQINGGTLHLTGGNDAIDSNGNVEFNGGVVCASGPARSMDGALDYDLSAVINGGTVLLVGDIGSTRGLDQSAQDYATEQVSGTKGATVQLVDAEGSVLAQMVAAYDFTTVLTSAAEAGCSVVVA